MIDIKENYEKKAIPSFLKSGYKNKFAIPHIDKVVLNIGLGSFLRGEGNQKEIMEAIKKDMGLIAGQAPCETKAKTSIAGFGTRKGQILGLKVTLRGKRMVDFLNRLVNITLPRTKDFSGVHPDTADAYGNLTLGIKDHTAFPEINIETAAQKIKRTLGLEITIVTSAQSKEEGLTLLKEVGFPLKK